LTRESPEPTEGKRCLQRVKLAILAFATLLVLISRAIVPAVDLTPKIAILETQAVSVLPGECQDIQKPPAIFLEILRTDFLVGEEGRAPHREHDLSGLTVRLASYKSARPERSEAFIRAHDDVRCEQIVTVLDTLVALEYLASSLYVGAPSELSELSWTRRAYKDLSSPQPASAHEAGATGVGGVLMAPKPANKTRPTELELRPEMGDAPLGEGRKSDASLPGGVDADSSITRCVLGPAADDREEHRMHG
jgi:biopolymer transport protein ExbD